MSLKFKSIDKTEWDHLILSNHVDNLFYQSIYHDVLNKHYKTNCSYYLVVDENEKYLALPVFHRKRDAALLTHFFYQAVYIKESISERKKIEAFDLLVSSLLKLYDKIDFKLDPKVVDVRSFVWNGFESKTYYSYHVDLARDLNYSENINRQLKKYSKILKVERLQSLDKELIESHIRDMIKNGLGKSEAEKVRGWINNFFEIGILDVFELRDSESKEQGSAIYLRDKNTAYLIAIKSNNSSQALLYDKVFEQYRTEKISHIDLLGANIQNVAIYKSQFDAQLISYHIVSYRKNKVWESVKKAIKLKIKSIYK